MKQLLILIMVIISSLTVFAKNKKKGLSIPGIGEGIVVIPQFSIVYFKKKSENKFKFKNNSERELTVMPRIENFSDKKDGKKHVIRPPAKDFYPFAKKQYKIGINQFVNVKYSLDPQDLPALSGVKIYPELAKRKGDVPRKKMNNVVVFSNLSKVKDDIKATHKYILKNKRFMISTNLKNEGSGIYYNYKINSFLTDLKGNKILNNSKNYDFAIFAPTAVKNVKNLFRANIPDGKYRHIMILQNPDSDVSYSMVNEIEIKNGKVTQVKA